MRKNRGISPALLLPGLATACLVAIVAWSKFYKQTDDRQTINSAYEENRVVEHRRQTIPEGMKDEGGGAKVRLLDRLPNVSYWQNLLLEPKAFGNRLAKKRHFSVAG